MIPNSIESIDDIKAIAELTPWVKELWTWKMYGEVKATYQGNLVIFNYTAKAQYAGRWNFFERVSRGLILNWRTGEIVARPFDKFFNLGEPSAPKFQGDIVSVTEKVDGSLGILYRDGVEYKIATRGSFTSEQALWATRWLNENVDLSDLPESWTLLFEIIYPENRIVVDYEGLECLPLLAIRDRHTGEYMPDSDARTFSFAHAPLFSPIRHTYGSLSTILAIADDLPIQREGFVIQDSTGQRFKVKGKQYLALHRLISGLSKKAVIKAWLAGVYSKMFAALPDEWRTQTEVWKKELENYIDFYICSVESAYGFAPKITRKEFAIYVNAVYPGIASLLFAKLDGKDYLPMIYKRMLKDA